MVSARLPALRVGLTGGAASGKSTVARMLEDLGAFVVDADAIVHELLQPGTPVHRAVVERFGPSILDAAGRVDRRRLATLVFVDAQRRRDLEALVHPHVIAEAQRRFAAEAARRPGAVLVFDAALLVETGHHRDFDQLVVTRCSPEAQLRRLRERGLSEEEARRRLAAQAPLESKLAAADHVVDTDVPLEVTREQVARLYEILQRQARQRAHSRAGASGAAADQADEG